MKLTIKKGYRSRNMLQGLVKGRYNMLEFIEGEEHYKFTFTDTEIPRVVVILLQREARWDEDMKWVYYFTDSTQCVTADWFSDIQNVMWALNEQLKNL